MKSAKESRSFGRRAKWSLIIFAALLAPASLLLPGGSAQEQAQRRPVPDVARMVGPVSQDTDLRDLPYIPPKPESEEVRLTRHLPGEGGRAIRGPRAPRAAERDSDSNAERGNAVTPAPAKKQSETVKAAKPARASRPTRRAAASSPALRQQNAPAVEMPSTTQTFAGMTSNLACGGCLPPDTDGDVGPNHYVQSVNSSIRVHDKSGNVLAGPVTYNSFFSAMGTSTPCGNNLNDGDGVVFYDHLADRWVVSDFAFSAFPGAGPFYQCIGVSKTSDPVTGGYWLYAVQVDPAHTGFIGDYPKFGLWPDAYYMAVNEFSGLTTATEAFEGVRVYALDRNSMINGGSANTIAFSILPADLGDQYSLLPATFRAGNPPPAGQPEWFMDVNSSATAGTVETQVFVRRFHADFTTPANSFFGVGTSHTPDATINVNGFVDAFDGTSGTDIVPNGTATTTQYLDTLGDKLMYPLVYQNLGGVESVYASQTVNNNQNGTGPTAIRWYQFNVTGNTISTSPVQQQSFNNNNDGLWRWMPSINVDNAGNVAIGYTASSATVDPGIRYAGRLATDPLNTLAQGEAVMTPGTGHQTSTSDRWGDYSSMFVDPTDTCTFYHTNEYYSATGSATWNTRVGSFKFPSCVSSPIATPTPTPTATPTPTPPPVVSAGPVTVTASAGTAGPTDYATVKAAFDAINAGTHQGNVNIYIIGDTNEGLSAVLNASGTGSASYTSISITPNGARTVTGAVGAGNPLIDLNGADFVTIDGQNSGGNSLTISNGSTSNIAGTSTIRFINGASNNTVKNCSILGSSTVAEGTAGGTVLFSTTTGTGVGSGNNNNVITGNNIGPALSTLPTKAVTGLGTAGNNTVNLNDVIDNNNIFDFFGGGAVSTTGIDLRAGNNNWTISNNRFYQTATRTFTTTALRYAGITLSGTTGANGNFHTITGNTIGFGAANGTGTTTITGSSNEVRGIDILGASSGTATSIQGNTISGINQTSSRASTTTGFPSFAGIAVSSSAGASATAIVDIGTVTGNTIGSLDGSSTIVINATSTTASTTPVFGILAFSGSSDNVSNNKIGAITIQGTGTVTGFRGIFAGATAGTTHTINNNIIGGTNAAGAITDTQVGDYGVYGIQTSTSSVTITGNTIRNFNGNATSNATGTVVESGIATTITGTSNSNTISRNVVHSLRNDTTSTNLGAIYAIDVTLPASTNVFGNVIERNLVHSLMLTSGSTSSQLFGIVLRGSVTAGVATTGVVRNNMVRLGFDKDGNSITSGLSIVGIRDIQGATGGNGTSVISYYFNSVYIGGAGVASASNTFAFNGSALNSTRSYVDNIFWNARSNASGAGKNYAVSVAGTAPNPAGLTMNYNDLLATGTGGFVGLFNAADQATLANWQSAVGQDANSISVDPHFVAPNGTATTGDLHVQNGSPVLGVGTPVAGITNDFDGDARDAIPDIGADEIVAPTSVATTLAVAPATGTYGGTVNLSATLTDGTNGISGKSVAFTLNGNGVGSATTNSSGVAALSNVSLSGINAGSYPSGVGASYAGEPGFNSASGTNSLTVNKADQTINFGALGDKTYGDADFAVSASASSGLSVSFSASGNCTVSGSTVHITGAGSCTITASQSGNSNYNAAADVPQSFNIGKANQTINFGALADKTYGDPDFAVSATASSGLSVSFNASGNCTVTGSTVHITGAGSCTITASQAGDSNYNAAPDVPQSFQIAKANQTITFNALADKTYGDPDFNVSASASSGLTVSFSATGNCTVSGSTVHITGAGSCTITASQAGDSNYNAAPDVARNFQIAKATPSITWGNPADIIYGTALSATQLNATANTPGSFVYTPAAGTVLASGNNQTLHVAFTPTDTTNYNNASKDVSINVLTAVLSVSMTADRNPAPVGLNFNYNATVSNTGNAAATNVTLTDVLPSLVTFTAVSSSQGSCSYNSLTRTVTCSLGSIGTGSSASVQITVKPRDEGTLNDTASIAASQWDPATGNSSASVNGLQAIKQIDLSASMSNAPDPIFTGQQTTYTTVVKNNSTVIGATGVALTDNLPASMTFVSATTSQGSLITPPVGSTGIVTANLGSLGTGATATVTITVKSTISGVITNSAQASGNESDPNPANNTGSAATTVKDAQLLKVLLAKQVLTGGCENTTGQVYLTGPAGPNGLTVPLSTSNLAGVSVPASVFIPAGQSVSPAFNVTTSPVATKQVGLVVAGSGNTSVSRGLTINVGSGSCPP